MKLNRLGLRVRIGLLAVVGLSAAFVAFAFLGLRAQQETTRQIESERLATARSIAEQIDRSLNHALYMLEVAGLREGVDLRDGDLQPERHALEDTYLLAELPAYRLLLLDREGQVLLTAPDDPGLIGLNLHEQAFVRQALRSGRPQVSDNVPASLLDQPVIVLSVPARDAQGEIAGLFLQAVDLLEPGLGGFLRHGRAGETSYAEIVDGTGTIIASTRPQHLLQPWEHFSATPLLSTVDEPQAGIYPSVEGPEGADFLALALVSAAGWEVVVEQKAHEALAPIQRARREYSTVGLVALLIALVLVGLTSREVVQPLAHLTTAARRIAGGELDRPIASYRQDEAGQLARAFEDMRASLVVSRAEMAQRTQELSVLHQTALVGAEARNVDELATRVTELLAAELYPDNVGFLFLDDQREFLHPHPSYHGAALHMAGISIPLGQGVTGTVAQTGQPLMIPDVKADPRYIEASAIIRSELCVPVRAGGQVAGVINVESAQLDAFTQEHLHLVSTVAGHVGIALEKLGLIEEAQRRASELEALRQVGLSMTATLELNAVLDAILKGTFQLLAGVQDAHIFLYEDGRLTFGAALWVDGRSGQPLAVPRSDGLTYTVARQGQPIIVSDMRTHPLFAGAPHKWRGAIIGLPLKIGERVVGVMNVAFPDPRAFPDSELQVMHMLADKAAIAIENARLHRAEHRRAEESTALLDIAQAVTSTLSLTQILKQIAIRTAQSCQANRCNIFLLDSTGERLEPLMSQFADGHPDRALWHRWRTTTADRLDTVPLFRQVLHQRRPVVLEDVTPADMLPHKWTEPFGIKKVLAVPLASRDRALGVMMLDHEDPARGFSQEQIDLAVTIAGQVAVSIENARLFEDTAARSRELATLFEASQAMSASLALDEVAHIVAAQLIRTLNVEECSIGLREKNGDRLVTISDVYWDPEQGWTHFSEEEWRTFMLDEYPATTKVMSTHQPLVVQADDPEADPAELAYMKRFNTQTLLMVPLVVRDEAIGLLELEESRHRHEFSQQDIRLAQALVAQAAMAIENARLYEETRHQAITDGLTRLFNARFFYQELERELERSQRYGRFCSLIMLDLDDFKKYNDRYGHQAGDDLLRELAGLMRGVIRQTDVPARYGGEEFTIILPETDGGQARVLAERLRDVVHHHEFVVRDTQRIGRITVSQGVATYPDDAQDVEGLVEAADMALLRAKETKDRVCVSATVQAGEAGQSHGAL